MIVLQLLFILCLFYYIVFNKKIEIDERSLDCYAFIDRNNLPTLGGVQEVTADEYFSEFIHIVFFFCFSSSLSFLHNNFAEFYRNKENHLKSVEIRWFERINN